MSNPNKKHMSSRKSAGKMSKAISGGKVNDITFAQVALNLEYWFDRGVNFEERIIVITGEIGYPLFDIVDAALTVMESASAKKTVTIRIHSFGGDLYEAIAVMGRIRKSPCYIITEGYGAIMSAATLLLASGKKSCMSEAGWYMYHEPSYDTEGRHSDHKHQWEQTEREWKTWAKWMAKLTKTKDEAFWYTTGINKDAYFTAEECLELGIVHEIFTI